jgi:hypothetical protein
MKVNINLSQETIDKLLKKYGYKRSVIKVGYTTYEYPDEELHNHLDCVNYYNQEIAYSIDNKPKELDCSLVTPSMVEKYKIENVVNELFNKAFYQMMCINLF